MYRKSIEGSSDYLGLCRLILKMSEYSLAKGDPKPARELIPGALEQLGSSEPKMDANAIQLLRGAAGTLEKIGEKASAERLRKLLPQ